MKYLHTCEQCKGSLHEVYGMPGRYWCPTCKAYFTHAEEGTGVNWKRVNA